MSIESSDSKPMENVPKRREHFRLSNADTHKHCAIPSGGKTTIFSRLWV